MERQNMMKSEINLRQLSMIIGIAFLVKLSLFIFLFPLLPETFSSFYGIGFADDYDKLALNIAQGYGYRFFPETALTATREPGYPLFLSMIFSLFGYSLPAARIANVFLSFASAILIILVAVRISHRRIVIIGSPLLFLFHPGVIIAESRGGFEILFILSLLCFALILYKSLMDGRLRWYLLAGLILGCIVLIRGTLLLFPLFLLLYLLVSDRHLKSWLISLQRIIVMTISMLIVMSPWIGRNYSLTDKFIPTSSVQGTAAHAGQYICENLNLENSFKELDRNASKIRTEMADNLGYKFRRGYYQYFYNIQDEIEFNSYLLKKVFDKYRDSPLLIAKCTSQNIFNFWFAGKTWSTTAINLVLQAPVLSLAIFGIWQVHRQKRMVVITPILLIAIYLMSLHLPIHSQARYSIPLLPFVSILACYGLIYFKEKLRYVKSNKSNLK